MFVTFRAVVDQFSRTCQSSADPRPAYDELGVKLVLGTKVAESWVIACQRGLFEFVVWVPLTGVQPHIVYFHPYPKLHGCISRLVVDFSTIESTASTSAISFFASANTFLFWNHWVILIRIFNYSTLLDAYSVWSLPATSSACHTTGKHFCFIWYLLRLQVNQLSFLCL